MPKYLGGGGSAHPSLSGHEALGLFEGALALIHRSTNQTNLLDNAHILVTHDAETEDSLGFYTPSNGRMLPTIAGWYVFVASAAFSGDNLTGSRQTALGKNSAGTFSAA